MSNMCIYVYVYVCLCTSADAVPAVFHPEFGRFMVESKKFVCIYACVCVCVCVWCCMYVLCVCIIRSYMDMPILWHAHI